MSFLKHRPHRRDFRALLSSHKPTSSSPATTDDIPHPVTDAYEHIRNLPRRPTDPTTTSTRPRSSSALRSVFPVSRPTPTKSADAAMAGQARITFTQPHVQPPVYVVTSLSDPPWETLELPVDKKKSDSGALIFARQFDNVAEGSYQYKIRIGDGLWVVDESKDSATDGSGNRNNVIYVKAKPSLPSSANEATLAQQDATDRDDATLSSEPSRDSFTPDTSSPPTPFVVVEKVADQDHPDYGDVEHEPLREDAAKRTADADPDFESIQPSTPREEQHEPASPPVPTVVIERTDDNLSHGDDFGDEATSAQKVAYELRAADATPNKVIISPDPELRAPKGLAGLQETAVGREMDEPEIPLFRHESFGTHPNPVEDDVEEESERSSIDQESLHTGRGTQSKFKEGRVEGNAIPTESLGELDNGPLLSHEPGLSEEDQYGEEDELRNGPLLSHETGFSSIEVFDDDKIIDDEYEEDTEEGPYPDDYSSDVPLLPHERDSRNSSRNNSDVAGGEPTFPYETATESPMFDNSQYFLHRTSTNGTLPHSIPRSDAEDEDLQDLSLERFPTNREEILERVATISSHLPIDETRDAPQSPEFSLQSQSCSAVDLKPAMSHTSLRPVDEEGDLDDEDVDKSDSGTDDHIAMKAQIRAAVDTTETYDTALPNQSEFAGSSKGELSSHGVSSSGEDSVHKNDGAHDRSDRLGTVYGSIATPAKLLNPLTPPLTPERKAPMVDAGEGPEDRSSTPKGSQDIEGTGSKPISDVFPSRSTAEGAALEKDGLFGALVKFLTACFGNRKQASGAALVLGIAAATYYYLNSVKG